MSVIKKKKSRSFGLRFSGSRLRVGVLNKRVEGRGPRARNLLRFRQNHDARGPSEERLILNSGRERDREGGREREREGGRERWRERKRESYII